MQCVHCGELRPTRYAAFAKVTGMIIVMGYEHVEGELCKPCAKSVGDSFTKHTALAGWGGFRSFFTTLFVLPANVAERARLKHVAPNAPDPDGDDLDRAELRAESAVRARKAVFWWTAAGLAFALILLLLAVAVGASRPSEESWIVVQVVGALLGVPALILFAVGLRHRRAANRLLQEASDAAN